MGKHHYKNEQIMKLLTILGGLVGIATMVLGLAGIADIGFINPLLGLNAVINFIVGIVISVLTLLTGLKPNAPLPFHWLVLEVNSIPGFTALQKVSDINLAEEIVSYFLNNVIS
ncbi:unnamed protein product [marine sediment metagenome]|uniref:Uncharacterized protein n=1 Tax=marine sediment metagenome TaxID=412755 RepID=X1F298_9ZZZZ